MSASTLAREGRYNWSSFLQRMATNALCLVCRLSWVLLAIGRLVSGESSSLQLTVGHTWDGSPVNQPATLTLASGKTGLLVTVQAK